MPTGFLLDSGFRLEHGGATVELWGVLEDGTSFLLRDTRFRSYLFLRAEDAARAAAAGVTAVEPTALTTMTREPVARLSAATPAELRGLRARLEGRGIATYEGDLKLTTRWLLDHDVRGALRIDGPARPGGGAADASGGPTQGGRVGHAFDNPRVAPATFVPRLRVLSIDLETDPTASRVLSAALHGPGTAEVIVVAGGGGQLPACAREVADEKALVRLLEERVAAIDPDVITGWNVVGFDLTVLERRAGALGLSLRLGRGPTRLSVSGAVGRYAPARARVEGRAVVDGADLFRGAFVKVPDFRLDTVAHAYLGRGKTLHDRPGGGRAEDIEQLFRTDLGAFVEYNLTDAALVSDLLEASGLLDLAVRRSLMTGMPLDRVASSIASFDALYLPELRRRGHVAPTLATSLSAGSALSSTRPTLGGAVLEPTAGLHPLVLNFDFRSLYPNVMRTFNIDPLTRLEALGRGAGAGAVARDEDTIITPGGTRFARTPGIVPELLERLLAERARARETGDAASSQATKILMNSFYGVLATSACRFHSPDVANAITEAGQAVLYWTKARVEELGFAVLYGDTDSLFVALGGGAARPSIKETGDAAATAATAATTAATAAQARAVGEELARSLTADLAAHLASRYGVESHLELRLEAVYLKIHFPPMRHGEGAARKRYAGLLAASDGREPEITFVGLESVRRDSTAAARTFQQGLYALVFADRGAGAIDEFVRTFVRSVRAGERDAELVYRKVLRKPLEEYTATTPPHVKAARLGAAASAAAASASASASAGATAAGTPSNDTREGEGPSADTRFTRRVEYVMTREGPDPIPSTRRLDHEHYVEKQLRPIAEAVLPLFGLDWDELAGNPRQLSLFPGPAARGTA